MLIIFWISLLILMFIYWGYLLYLILVSTFVKKTRINKSNCPFVSLVVPVYNEEKIIEEKIKNSLSLIYPKDKLEIIIASDGSTDNTKIIVGKYTAQGIKFFDFSRAGKLATLNRIFPYTKGEILVLTDASAMFVEDALQKLVRHFADDSVGVVTGVERIKKERKSVIGISEGIYWDYETKLKEWEGKIFSTVGANGPIYAIRRELFPSISTHLNLCDDMTISFNAVKKGKRIILEPEAIAFEEASLSLKEEWLRKIRIATQAWQSLFYDSKLLIPFRSPLAFPLLFHKVFRWLTLPLMMILFISNIFIGGIFYKVFLLLQISFHTLLIIGLVLLWRNIKIPSIMSFLGYFLFTNLAQVIGLYNAIFNKGKPIWQPIKRA